MKPTIGADFSNKELDVDGRVVVAQIWDTAGQERYHSLGQSFYRGSDCCAIVIDLTDPCAMDTLNTWKDSFFQHCGCADTAAFPLVVFGNKSDLADERKVKREEIEFWCSENGDYDYVETSAQGNISVEEGF